MTKKGSTKERIIETSIDMFSEKGYAETSLRDIAQVVGVNPSSIYGYFRSKNEILAYILGMRRELNERNTLDLDKVDELIRTEDARTVLNQLFYNYSTDNVTMAFRIQKVILQEQYRVPEVMAFMRDYIFQNSFKYIETVLEKLKAVGKIKPIDCKMYAKLFQSVAMSYQQESTYYSLSEYDNDVHRVKRSSVNDFLIDQII
jgi:AcrR family transcriptional regulator